MIAVIAPSRSPERQHLVFDRDFNTIRRVGFLLQRCDIRDGNLDLGTPLACRVRAPKRDRDRRPRSRQEQGQQALDPFADRQMPQQAALDLFVLSIPGTALEKMRHQNRARRPIEIQIQIVFVNPERSECEIADRIAGLHHLREAGKRPEAFLFDHGHRSLTHCRILRGRNGIAFLRLLRILVAVPAFQLDLE